MRAAIYTRLGRVTPGQDGHARQATECRGWLAWEGEAPEVEVFSDTGVSQGDYLRLLAAAEQGLVDTVLVTGLDRLPRVGGQGTALDRALDLGLRIVAVDGSMDTAKATDAFLARMLVKLPEPGTDDATRRQAAAARRSRDRERLTGAATLF